MLNKSNPSYIRSFCTKRQKATFFSGLQILKALTGSSLVFVWRSTKTGGVSLSVRMQKNVDLKLWASDYASVKHLALQ